MANLVTRALSRLTISNLIHQDVKVLNQNVYRNYSSATPDSQTSHSYAQQPIDDDVDIKVEKKGDVSYVEGIPIDPNTGAIWIDKKSKACALCRLNVRNLDYTDVMVLAQFIKRDGSLVTYHESQLCSKQYLKVKSLIKQAQRCNLIKRSPDYLVPGPWHDLNTYLEPDRRRDQPMKIVKKEYWKI